LGQRTVEAIAQALREDLLKGVLQFPGVEYLQWQHDELVAELVTQNIKGIQGASCLSEAQAIAFAPVMTPTEYEQLKLCWKEIAHALASLVQQ
jgi:hypothetical protein